MSREEIEQKGIKFLRKVSEMNKDGKHRVGIYQIGIEIELDPLETDEVVEYLKENQYIIEKDIPPETDKPQLQKKSTTVEITDDGKKNSINSTDIIILSQY